MRVKVSMFLILALFIILIYYSAYLAKIIHRSKVMIIHYKAVLRRYHSSKSSPSNEMTSIRSHAPLNMSAEMLSLVKSASILGKIFPRFEELNYRVNEQLDLIEKHWRDLKKLPIKMLLRVGDFNFRDVRWDEGTGGDCKIDNCKFISDMRMASKADALVFSELNADLLNSVLPKPKNQIWIAQHLESPKHNRIDTSLLRNLINWTASYRPDSTISMPYGFLVPKKVEKPHRPPSNRTKKVAWLVSNCYTTNYRGEYVQELSKYIEVDTFGKCGSFACDEQLGCLKQISAKYKFYLAFENSNCANYISEKFTDSSLGHDLVPIVMGASRKEYEAWMPDPTSFIHVDDFESPAHLAGYLHRLDANATLYNRFFDWKAKYRIEGRSRHYCRLCALLHLRDLVSYVHWYEDYSRWWDVCY